MKSLKRNLEKQLMYISIPSISHDVMVESGTYSCRHKIAGTLLIFTRSISYKIESMSIGV